MVGHAAGFTVHIGAAEVFGADHFTGGGFYQWWAGEEDGGLVAHHDGFIRHGRHIGATSGAGAHDHGDLRDAHGRHIGLVEEDSPKVLAVREYLILARQVGAAGVDQVDARQAILLSNGLRAQVFFHRQRVVATAFYRGVVGHDHAFDTLDSADAGHYTCRRHFFAVHLMGGQLTDFEKRRADIQQTVNPFTWQQFAARGVTLLSLGAAAFVNAGEQGAQVVDLGEHRRTVGGELRRTGVDLGVQNGHLARSVRLFGFVEQFAADQHAANFAGAGANFIKFGVAQQAAGRVLVGIAVTTEQLDGVQGHFGGHFGGVEDHGGGVFARLLTTVAGLGDVVEVGLGGVHASVHVGQLALYQLELADRLLDLLAFVHVGQHHVHAGGHDPGRAAREHGALVVQAAHQHAHAAAFRAEDVLFRYFAILEHQFAGVGAAHAQLVQLLVAVEALVVTLDDKRGHAA